MMMIIIIQWRNSPLPGLGRLTARFLDHAEELLGRVISSAKGGQASTLRKFLIIPDPPARQMPGLNSNIECSSKTMSAHFLHVLAKS
jgi:hypothetical protein